jgi:serine protease
MDVGWSCGANFVNASGTLDGYSIVEGHEYAETLTDEFPSSGWYNNVNGENGDECAWISSGTGAASDVGMATGSFAMQSTWSNDTNSCAISHAVVTGSNANTVTVTNPGSQSGSVGSAVSLQIQASDSASGQTLTYSATGLPAGLSISSSTGLISGTPTTATTSNATVTAKDTTGAQGSASFSWTISPSGNIVSVTNPGSQTTTAGASVSLQIHASDSASGQTLTYSATGLPSGLRISSSTGLITGSPNTANTYAVKVTVTDSTGAKGSASFSWTVQKRHR